MNTEDNNNASHPAESRSELPVHSRAPSPAEANGDTPKDRRTLNDQDILRRNTVISTLGSVGKASAPLYLALTTKLYGIELFGIFATAQVFAELAMSMVTAGFNDAALMSAAQRNQPPPTDEARLADGTTFADDLSAENARGAEKMNKHHDDQNARDTHALATSIFWIVALCISILLPAAFLSPRILPRLYEWGDTLAKLLQIMAVGVPLFGLSRLFVATTIGHQDFRYDAAVNGIARPAGLLIFATSFYFLFGGVEALALAWVGAQALAFAVSLHGFLKYESPKALIKTLRVHGLDPSVLAFAVPQSLSVTFQRFAAGMGVIMLGVFGYSSIITGVYAACVQVIDNAVNTVRFIFTNVFNPWVPRLTARNERPRLAELLTSLQLQSAWACTGVILALLLFEPEVLGLFVPDYTADPTVFAALLLSPWLLASIGLVGSVIVLTGRSRLNLFNAIAASALNATLNALLIPPYGALGAALGTGISTALLCVLQTIESKRLEQVAPNWNRLAPALLAMLGATSALVLARHALPLALPLRVTTAVIVAASAALFLRRGAAPLPTPP